MAVKVHPSLARRIEKYPGGITLLVRGAPDPEAAARALGAARVEIAGLDGGWESAPGLSPGDTNGPTYLSVASTPSGPMLYVDGGHTPVDLLQTIPAIVARHLKAAGVRDAQVVWPDRQGPNAVEVYQVPRVAVLCLFPPPPPPAPTGQRQPKARAPASWFDETAAWLAEEVGPDGMVWTITGMASYFVPARDVAAQLGKRIGSQTLLVGDLGSRLRAASTTSLAHEVIILRVGGPDASDGDLLAAADSLVAIARRLAPTASYAEVDFEPGSSAIAAAPWTDRLPPPKRERPVGITEMSRFSAELVVDGYGYQILGPGHLARLDRALDRAGPEVRVEPIADGRFEVWFGDLSSWTPDHPERADLRAAARQLLLPCILTGDEAEALYWERIGQENPRFATLPRRAPGPLPDEEV